jgi:hypothetical protein
MRCLNAFGDRIAVRDLYRKTAKIQVCVAFMNRFLGPVDIRGFHFV